MHGATSQAGDVADCNASRVTVDGVNIMLLSRGAHAAGPVFTGQPPPPPVPAGQPGPSLQQLDVQRRKRVRTRTAARAQTAAAAAPPPSTPADRLLPANWLENELEWDYMHFVVRQWSMEVEVSLEEQGQLAQRIRNLRRALRGGKNAGQPPAIQVHGSFGVRSSRTPAPVLQRTAQERAEVAGGSPEGSPFPSAPNLQAQAAQQQRAGGTASRRPPPIVTDSAAATPQRAGTQRQGGSGGNGGRAAQGAGAAEAAPALTVHVNVMLKALVPELTPESIVQLLRVVDRVTTYENYRKFWRVRPAVSVTESPVAWWQHAGRAIINDCR